MKYKVKPKLKLVKSRRVEMYLPPLILCTCILLDITFLLASLKLRALRQIGGVHDFLKDKCTSIATLK